ncbi:MAG: sodium:solute symporter [Planctomycetota bacterium]|nr:MAG: sodium:solute symporter [Planctomycetota bacterium]
MNMYWVDWSIVLALLAFMVVVILATRHNMRGVADFLAAGRCGGRYLLCISEGIAGLGAVTLLAFWQQYTKTGFTGIWWSLPNWPLLFVLALSGWVLYRYRQTRALTLAQFFEMRYSRRFRIFAGMVAFASGIINYGVFPYLNARLFIYFCGLPETFTLAGFNVDTFTLVMLVLLSLALYFTFMGGQIAIMLTNFMQGIFCMTILLVVCLVLFNHIGWNHISEVVAMAPEDQSLANPFKISKTEGFNMWFFLIQYFIWFYCWKAWQGTQGYYVAAKTPHEARMSQILGTWRYFAQEMIVPIFAICAIAVLFHPDFAQQAAGVKEVLAGFDDKGQSEMTVPLVLGRILPIGLMGALTAVMVAAAVSTDESYLHSWGSIFIQDVLMPLRGKPLSPEKHLLYLRYSICGVALFAFCFSMVFTLEDYIRMFFAVTGAIYLGGAGCCVIGGLYTRRGTTAGAWGAMITGIVVASTALITNQIANADPEAGGLRAWLQLTLYHSEVLKKGIVYLGGIDGQVMTFVSAMCAIPVYFMMSIVFGARKFDLDRMLHRGKYAVADDVAEGDATATARWKWLGINDSFTWWDKVIYIGSVVWVLLWGVVFAVGIFYHYAIHEISDEAWMSFWHFIIWMSIVLGVVTTLWFLIGGLRDLKIMFELLRTRARDHTDDGTVYEGDQPSAETPVSTMVDAD